MMLPPLFDVNVRMGSRADVCFVATEQLVENSDCHVATMLGGTRKAKRDGNKSGRILGGYAILSESQAISNAGV